MQETLEYTDDYLNPDPDELFPEHIESVPELINSVEDAILYQSARNDVTHQPILNDEGLIVATRQDMMLGYRDDEWPRNVYRWTTVKAVTHEEGDKAGKTDYSLVFSNSSSDTQSAPAPFSWTSGAEQIEVRRVHPRGVVMEKATPKGLMATHDSIMEATKVVDLAKEVVQRKTVERFIGRGAARKVVSKIKPRDD